MNLAVRESGDPTGPSILLLHGVGNDGSIWDNLAEALQGYHCIAPDLPGHGRSRRLPWRSRDESARLVASLIEGRATSRRAHLVGLSLGGSIALELLATRPDLLGRVIVDGCAAVSSPLTGPIKIGVSLISPFLRFGLVARLVGQTFGVKRGASLDGFASQMRAVDPRSFRRAFVDASDVRITGRLLNADCPTLLVAGERELTHVRASNRLLAEGMPNAQALVMPGGNHGWGLSQFPGVHQRMVAAWIGGRALPSELLPESASIHRYSDLVEDGLL